MVTAVPVSFPSPARPVLSVATIIFSAVPAAFTVPTCLPRPAAAMAFAAALLACLSPKARADAFPGKSSAPHARLDETALIWINPARLADTGTGFDVGAGSGDGASKFRLAFRFPAGVTLGWEIASLYAPEEAHGRGYDRYFGPNNFGGSYGYGEENLLHAFALAKQGFGGGPWLRGLRLGIATRAATRLFTIADEYDIPSRRLPWSLDVGMALDIPIPEHYGMLAGGLYAAQSDLEFTGARQVGAQARWLDPSGLARMEAGLAVIDSRMDPLPGYIDEESAIPSSRLAAAILFRNFEIGGVWLPGDDLGGMEAGFRMRSWSFLRGLRIGAQFLIVTDSDESSNRVGKATMWLDARIRFKRDAELASDYGKYRDRNPGPVALAKPVDTGAPALSQDEWQRNWALYQEDKIGTWRGTVWPYVNTFGIYTTFYIPAGTSCLAVGNYSPGWILLGTWGGLMGLVAFAPGSVEEKAFTYLLAQSALKLVDFTFARRHVKAHNKALREKYRLGIAPRPGGGALALGF